MIICDTQWAIASVLTLHQRLRSLLVISTAVTNSPVLPSRGAGTVSPCSRVLFFPNSPLQWALKWTSWMPSLAHIYSTGSPCYTITALCNMTPWCSVTNTVIIYSGLPLRRTPGLWRTILLRSWHVTAINVWLSPIPDYTNTFLRSLRVRRNKSILYIHLRNLIFLSLGFSYRSYLILRIFLSLVACVVF